MRPKTVLIVEDNDDLRRLFTRAFRAHGYDVYEADDGLDALRLIETERPDAVVLDLTLRTLDGLSVHDEMAANASTRHIPVVIVTGSTRDLSGLNVAAILRKPVAPELLVAAIKNALDASAR